MSSSSSEQFNQRKKYEEQHLKDVIDKYFSSSDISPTIQIRYRPPFIHSSTHDARGDAMSLAFESMTHRNFPLWAAHILANNFVDLFADELQTNKIPFTDDYKVIDANLWCRQIIESFENYIKELSKGGRDLPEFPKGWDNLPISFCAERNRKPKMEDRHIILPSLGIVAPSENKKQTNNDGFFGVFDGHHGAECAAYANAHFTECLFESMDDKNDMKKLLKVAFDKIDKRITARCRNENIKSGTTASCLYLKEKKMAYLAWCGDSSIGVLKNDSIETISIPHKPEDPKERKRIEEAGGMVVNISGVPRLNGVLNLSRSLGDIRAKPMVSPEPDVLAYPLTEKDYILFLASDGVWDNLEEEEIYDSVKTFVADHSPQDYKLLAECIVNKAKEAGAVDNLTLICVFIKPLENIWKNFSS